MGVAAVFFHGKQADQHTLDSIAEFLVFDEAVLYVRPLLGETEVVKNVFTLGNVVGKNIDEQRVLQFEDGAEYFVLKPFFRTHVGKLLCLFDVWANAPQVVGSVVHDACFIKVRGFKRKKLELHS